MQLISRGSLGQIILFCSLTISKGAEPLKLTLTGDWSVQATLPADGSRPELKADINVTPTSTVVVTAEKHSDVPLYNSRTAGYARGVKLNGVRNAELTTRYLLDPESLIVRAGPKETDPVFVMGKDYDAELTWGNFGRLNDGQIAEKQTVYVSYRHSLLRIDSILLNAENKLEYRVGKPVAGSPLPPSLASGEQLLANIWFPGPLDRLTEDNLFPILETQCPPLHQDTVTITEKWAPKSVAKLRSGAPIRILAWGDSVTESTYLPNREKTSLQSQFVARLKERFPKARIELITEGWGGRSTRSFLNVPPGMEHNYAEKVLGSKPDLIISEFVNDAYLTPEGVEKLYSKVLNDFQEIGAEWIILTPHYVRPDWMGLTREREVDEDPRPYVAGLRQFSNKHQVPIADAAYRYGRLWRQGIPYTSLMSNAINHPDARGMTIFADALMEIFPEK